MMVRRSGSGESNIKSILSLTLVDVKLVSISIYFASDDKNSLINPSLFFVHVSLPVPVADWRNIPRDRQGYCHNYCQQLPFWDTLMLLKLLEFKTFIVRAALILTSFTSINVKLRVAAHNDEISGILIYTFFHTDTVAVCHFKENYTEIHQKIYIKQNILLKS